MCVQNVRKIFSWLLVLSLLLTTRVVQAEKTLTGGKPIVIAHRGASGYRPEHTLEAYALAIEQRADYIESDMVMTRDGELIARHETLLARVKLNDDGSICFADGKPDLDRSDTSTNVWSLPKYANRLAVKRLDGDLVGGWFAEDFTAAEIRADIRAQERMWDVRLANNQYNDRFVLPTLQEVINVAKAHRVGVYIEIKHPEYFLAHAENRSLKRMEDKLVEVLHANYANQADSPVYIQSFEVASLQYLHSKTKLRLVQLVGSEGAPRDFSVSGDSRTYADLLKPGQDGLDFVKTYADGIGASLDCLIPRLEGKLGAPTTVVSDAHLAGLQVHAWTFRAENRSLPLEYRSSVNPVQLGDLPALVRTFVHLGLDGVFTDHPDLGVAGVNSAR